MSLVCALFCEITPWKVLFSILLNFTKIQIKTQTNLYRVENRSQNKNETKINQIIKTIKLNWYL